MHEVPGREVGGCEVAGFEITDVGLWRAFCCSATDAGGEVRPPVRSGVRRSG